jgi:hypothetical protein
MQFWIFPIHHMLNGEVRKSGVCHQGNNLDMQALDVAQVAPEYKERKKH